MIDKSGVFKCDYCGDKPKSFFGEFNISTGNHILCEENAMLKLRLTGNVCPVCFTNSWEPCPKETPNAVEDPVVADGWMVCGMCQVTEGLVRMSSKLTDIFLAE